MLENKKLENFNSIEARNDSEDLRRLDPIYYGTEKRLYEILNLTFTKKEYEINEGSNSHLNSFIASYIKNLRRTGLIEATLGLIKHEFAIKKEIASSEWYWKSVKEKANSNSVNEYRSSSNFISLELTSTKTVKLNIRYKDIIQAIEKSKYIYTYDDDFDENGSKGYKIETWVKAIEYLINFSSKVYRKFDYLIAPPKIFHGDNGSIDFLWKLDNFKLLLNIPEEGDFGFFYGEYKNGTNLEGKFETTKVDDSMLILAPGLKV